MASAQKEKKELKIVKINTEDVEFKTNPIQDPLQDVLRKCDSEDNALEELDAIALDLIESELHS